MKPIIQNKNKLNFKNFLSNLKYLQSKKKDNDLALYQTANLKFWKYFNNFENEKQNKNKRKKNNNNICKYKYTSSLKDLKEIIKRISKTVDKEKIKIKNENIKKNRKEKSENIYKRNNIISKNDIIKGNQKAQIESQLELEKENKRKKIFNNIKPIEINEIDLIIKNKKNTKYYINDNSNISLPPLIYTRQLFKYNEPILIGLNNLGYTCYLNSILQCLNQTEPLTNYFLSEEGESKVKNNNLVNNDKSPSLQLTPSYLEVVKNLWDIKNNKKSYSPINFYEKLNEMNKIFILNKPNDSKNLLDFIFKQFHKELNTKHPTINNSKGEFSFEQYDRSKMFNKFLINYTNNNCSIISNNFYGITEIHKECIKCKNFFINQGIMLNPILYDFKIYKMLIFPLDEIKKMKMNKNNNKNIDKININDCFDYYQNKKISENKIFCKRCNQLTKIINSYKLFNAPNILIIILNRGKPNSYNIKIEFNKEIELTDYIQFKQNKIIYNLYGVVTHLGIDRDEGHFVAECKNLIDNLWYKYNDSKILKINDIQKEVLDFGKPYILFYQKQIEI